jgi:glycosyltransferase involved in cell wall biosynthesis
MRVLYFHQHFTTPKGATGTRSYEFARALVKRGHEVVMVCGNNQIAKLGLETATPASTTPTSTAPAAAGKTVRGFVDGIEVIALPVGYSNRDGVAKRLLAFVQFAIRSVLVALREPCDLAFATSTPLSAAIPGIFAKLFRRKPFVFEVRDLWPELPRAIGLKNPFLLAAMSALEWTAYHAADRLIGLSLGIVEGIRRRAPAKTPIALIPNGCDLDLFKPQTETEPPTPAPASAPTSAPASRTFTAGFTGAHGLANGLEAVLAAAAVLKKRGANHIRFLFVGDGNRKDALVAQAREQQLDNCEFLPPVPKTELAKITASLDCGLMVLKNIRAFYYGTSPNKFFDYIAAGVPVLNNYPGWLADLITAHNCGTAVPPDDPEAFAAALETLAAAPDRNASMRQNARHLAETQFNRQTLATDFCDFLEAQGTAP